MAGAP
ncbi:hypothetical protein VCHC50A1_0895, partial [Vibrio cholerae HC-50A1]